MGVSGESEGCAAARTWRLACAVLCPSAAPTAPTAPTAHSAHAAPTTPSATDEAWQKVVDASPPDSVWHSISNCVAYQVSILYALSQCVTRINFTISLLSLFYVTLSRCAGGRVAQPAVEGHEGRGAAGGLQAGVGAAPHALRADRALAGRPAQVASGVAGGDGVRAGAADGRRGGGGAARLQRGVRAVRSGGVAAGPAAVRGLRAGRAGRLARGVRRARQARARRVLQAHASQLRRAAHQGVEPVLADPQVVPHGGVRVLRGGGAREHRARDLHTARTSAHRQDRLDAAPPAPTSAPDTCHRHMPPTSAPDIWPRHQQQAAPVS